VIFDRRFRFVLLENSPPPPFTNEATMDGSTIFFQLSSFFPLSIAISPYESPGAIDSRSLSGEKIKETDDRQEPEK